MLFNETIGYKTTAGIRANVENIDYYPFHSHNTYIEILCVLNGSYHIFDSANEYNLIKHDVYIFNSEDPHKIISTDASSSVLLIHIDKSHYLNHFKQLGLGFFTTYSPNPQNRQLPEMNLLRFYLAKVYMEYSKDTPSSILLDNLAANIIDLLFEQFHDYMYKKLPSGKYDIIRRKYDGRNEKEFYRIYRIADYMEDYYFRKVSLTEIAELEYLSVPYLSKYIKENIGVTFSELLSIKRCCEAEKLLASTNKSTDTIATEVGFANRSTLFKHFTKWYFKSPSAYRKEIINDLGDNAKVKIHNNDKTLSINVLKTYLNG